MVILTCSMVLTCSHLQLGHVVVDYPFTQNTCRKASWLGSVEVVVRLHD